MKKNSLFFICLSLFANSCSADTISNDSSQAVNVEISQKVKHGKRVNKFLSGSLKGKNITLKKMVPEMLEEKLFAQLEAGNIDSALRYAEQLIKIADSPEDLCDYLLILANLYFDSKQYGKAEIVYKRFHSLCPGDIRAEFSLYRAILCAVESLRDIDQDQEKTHEALKLAQEYLDREIYTEFTEHVRELHLDCCQRIINHELMICDFYLQRRSYLGAHRRIAYIRKEWLDKCPQAISSVEEREIELHKIEPRQIIPLQTV